MRNIFKEIDKLKESVQELQKENKSIKESIWKLEHPPLYEVGDILIHEGNNLFLPSYSLDKVKVLEVKFTTSPKYYSGYGWEYVVLKDCKSVHTVYEIDLSPAKTTK